jgi:hypothetical protein
MQNNHHFHGQKFVSILTAFTLSQFLSVGVQLQAHGRELPSEQTQSLAQAQTPAQKPDQAQLQSQAQGQTQPAADAVPVKSDNLETCLRELHESLRRMKGDVNDVLHEVSRTQDVYNNGVPVSSNPWANSPNYLISGGMVAQDSLSHAVYLPPRSHWLNNSMTQMLDLETKLETETANIGKLLKTPGCSSAVRAQGFVLSDITTELGQELGVLQAAISEEKLSNAKISVNAHKIADTISGMEGVGDRLWKEAPRGLKLD